MAHPFDSLTTRLTAQLDLCAFAFGCGASYQGLYKAKHWPILSGVNMGLTLSRLIPLIMILCAKQTNPNTTALKEESVLVLTTSTTLLALAYADENNQAVGLIAAFAFLWLAEQIISGELYATNGSKHNPMQIDILGSVFLAIRAAVLGASIVEYSSKISGGEIYFDPTITATFMTILMIDVFADPIANNIYQAGSALSDMWAKATAIENTAPGDQHVWKIPANRQG